MKHLARFVLLLALAASFQSVCLSQAAARPQEPPPPRPPEMDGSSWKRYTSAAGGYSALFPGAPVEETKPAPPPAQNLPMYMATVRTMAEYAVCYADFPSQIEGTDKVAAFLAGVRDAGARGIGGRLLDDKEIEYVGHPGRVYQVEFGGGYLLTAKTFVVKNRLYMVAATYYGEKKAPPEVARFYEAAARRFIGSFMLTSDEDMKKQVGNTDPASPPSPLPETDEGEVARVKKQLEAAGEPVFGICAADKPCDPIKGKTINGRVIKGDVVLPKAVNRPQPVYPAIARAARAAGSVVVQVIVDESGKVIAAQAISGNALLHVAAVEAARAWEFTPTLIDGRPVKVIGTITFNFVLQ